MIAEGFGPKRPKPINVRLTDGDLIVLHEIAKERATHRGYATKPSTWKQGLMGPLELSGVGRVMRAVAPILCGAIGEHVTARHLGIQPDWSLNRCGDGGIDLIVSDLTIQVKTCQKEAGANLVRVRCYRGRRIPFKSVIHVFCSWNRSREALIRGWTWTRAISGLPEVPSIGQWMNIDVSPLDLLPMCRLRDEIAARMERDRGAT